MKYLFIFLIMLCTSCTETKKLTPLEIYKGSVIIEKEIYNVLIYTDKKYYKMVLKVKGKKQHLQKDSFYYVNIKVYKFDYEHYDVNDTIQ